MSKNNSGFELGKGPLEGETDDEFEARQKREKLVDDLANWMDTHTISEMVVSHLEEQGDEVTLESCKETWYGTLENLGGGVGIARASGEAAKL